MPRSSKPQGHSRMKEHTLQTQALTPGQHARSKHAILLLHSAGGGQLPTLPTLSEGGGPS